jgi:DNA-binding PadR family transcriptional regulator
MSLRHALLGLLADRPASGYELARRFEGDLGRYAWQAGHTGIYPELVRMAEQGLIEADDAGPRGRKIYTLTDEGRAELRRWLMTPPQQSTVRNETVLRMFLVQALDPDDARTLLTSIAERCATELDRLRPVLETEDAEHGTDELPFGRLAGEYGIRQYEAVLGWARWSLDRLDAATRARTSLR